MGKSIKWIFFSIVFIVLMTGQARWCAGQNPADLGAVSWWTFDGDAVDRISSNHGLLMGAASFDAGVSGQALKVNGSPDHVQIPDAPALHITGSMTISVWVKPLASGQYAKILSKRNGNRFWFLGVDDLVPYGGVGHDVWRVTPRPSGEGCDYVENTPILPNIWHHLVFVFDADAGQMTMYIDQTPSGPFAVPEGFNLPALEGVSLSIGADSQGTERFFNGLIDELSLYNRALTGDEISGLYHLPSQSSCWWSTWAGDYQQGFRKGGGTVIADRSDISHALGEVNGDTAEGTFFSLGYQGYLELGIDDLVRDGALTVFETTWGASGPLEKASVYAWNGGSWVNLGLADNSENTDTHPSTFQWNGFAANRFKIVDATDPDDNPSDSDGFDLDGLLVCGEQETAAAPTASLSADPELIYEGGSSTLTWETANASTVAITPDVGTVTAGGSVQVSPSDTTTYTLSASGAGTATALAQVTVASLNPAAWWPMDGSVLDASGNGNHGTLFGTAAYSEGLFNQALMLDGQADYALAPDSTGLTLTDDFTLSAWVNPSAYGQYAKIISKRIDNRFWFLGLDQGVPYGGVGNGWYRVTPRPSGADCDYVDTRVITPGEWHHLAFAFDHADKSMALWVDGQSRGRFETRDDFNLPALEGINVGIGADNQGSEHFFQGRIDELRV